MKYADITKNEIEEIVNKYVEYYNGSEEGCWTYETAYKRIHQVMTTNGAKCLVQYDDNGNLTGFVMGYYKQYDDILAYFLEEIVIFKGYQGKGYGSQFLTELEMIVKENGAEHIEFLSVNDEHHMHFYKKAGYYAANNFAIMGKHWENPKDANAEKLQILEVTDSEEKKRVARLILEALTEWFEIPETREAYIVGSADKIFFAAYEDGRPVGFITLNETGKSTAEIYVMGVLKDHHRDGIGRKLFEKLKEKAMLLGYSFMQVKTVQMGKYDDYDITNRFYLSLGFKEFEVFPLLWDEANPCQIYVMGL